MVDLVRPTLSQVVKEGPTVWTGRSQLKHHHLETAALTAEATGAELELGLLRAFMTTFLMSRVPTSLERGLAWLPWPTAIKH